MKKLIISLILFAVIGAGDIIFTYTRSASVFGHMEGQKDIEENSDVQEYEYERPERKPKIPEKSSDFINQIDCEEYFADKKGIKHAESGQYLVSHNVFSNNDGSTTTVDITSVFYKHNIYSGGKYSRIVNDVHGSVSTPCAYDSKTSSPTLKYKYMDNFSLLLDDYNNDGNPDYLIRTGSPEDGGAYYYIQYSVNEAYPVHHTNFNTPKRNSDSAVFIYGRTADSIRLDHTDMDHFFFLTKDGDEIVPYMYDSGFENYDFESCSYANYAVGGKLYSAFYENGVLTLRATDCNGNEEIYDDAVTVTVRKLDDQIWSRCGEFSVQFAPDEDYCTLAHIAQYEQSFEKGLYQLEINTPDGIAYAEFAVRI